MRGPLAVALAATLAVSAPATAQPAPPSLDMRPKPVERGERDARLAEDAQKTIDLLKAYAERLKQASGDQVDLNAPYDLSGLKKYGFKKGELDIAGAMGTILNLLEAFEFIDPREKFLQPEYSPRGMPVLPSRAMEDGGLSAADYGAFRELQDRINKAKRHLEGNYVVLKQTELKTKRLEELAGSAANMSGIAGAYWATIQGNPNDPMNVAKARFYATYDRGQESGLEFLNEALKEMGEFEKRVYGDANWYLYFGLPYYNYMQARYTRPGA